MENGPPQVPFRTAVREISDVPVVHVGGEVCLATAPRFEEAVREAALGRNVTPRRVIIDVRDVEFMDSEGLKAIFALVQRLREQSVEVRLVAGDGQVSHLFDVAGVSERLPLYRDLRSAVG